MQAKETISRIKRQPTEWKEMFPHTTSDKGLISKTYKELITQPSHTSNPIKTNGEKTSTGKFPRQTYK